MDITNYPRHLDPCCLLFQPPISENPNVGPFRVKIERGYFLTIPRFKANKTNTEKNKLKGVSNFFEKAVC